MVFNLSEQNSIANQFLMELRDKALQQDRLRFRKNLERLGEIMSFEISKRLTYTTKVIDTPLDKCRVNVMKEQPVLITILRAGLPFFQGFINFFDRADAGFIGAYRRETLDTVQIKFDYITSPITSGREVILIDPMLATGKSLLDSVNQIMKRGKPANIHIASLVAAPEGIKFLAEQMPMSYSLWTYAIDEKLNAQSYIVPGLGDAGDLSFGAKL
ncbi:uracil phosphoribosyltransferase [Pseudochryseolinea flava]|uniref:Uracil phosphoribosyltransferase n=1 Tax=Pseudochryseolinea flava TaxID=2059302 RepID=A0A364Y8J5_9BACT|nr:uracil phosphoribosyltransferase [Pseudochryseolinea flava]RAW03436.1 uracil phosphoribosyltransferase [Pseudochryseolinea flava]